MLKQTIEIGGMSCGHCVSSVRKALAAVDGVQVDDVRVGAATVSVEDARAPDGFAAVAAAVRSAGFEVLATAEG